MRSIVVGLLIGLTACGNAATPSTGGVQPPSLASVVAPTTPPEQVAVLTPTIMETSMSIPDQTPLLAASITAIAPDPALEEQAGSCSVRIIVMLNIPWRPEGELPDDSAVLAQRQAISDAQRALLGRLAAYNVTEVTTYQFIPSLAMAVDGPALLAMRSDPAVANIQPDALVSPSGEVPAASNSDAPQ